MDDPHHQAGLFGDFGALAGSSLSFSCRALRLPLAFPRQALAKRTRSAGSGGSLTRPRGCVRAFRLNHQKAGRFSTRVALPGTKVQPIISAVNSPAAAAGIHGRIPADWVAGTTGAKHWMGRDSLDAGGLKGATHATKPSLPQAFSRTNAHSFDFMLSVIVQRLQQTKPPLPENRGTLLGCLFA